MSFEIEQLPLTSSDGAKTGFEPATPHLGTVVFLVRLRRPASFDAGHPPPNFYPVHPVLRCRRAVCCQANRQGRSEGRVTASISRAKSRRWRSLRKFDRMRARARPHVRHLFRIRQQVCQDPPKGVQVRGVSKQDPGSRDNLVDDAANC
jgi:hypothetical protein